MAEMERLVDRVMVLRDGRNVGKQAEPTISRMNVVQMMVGRTVEEFLGIWNGGNHEPSEILFEAREAKSAAAGPYSHSVRRQQILGLAGLVAAMYIPIPSPR